jgi:hypothetical protein
LRGVSWLVLVGLCGCGRVERRPPAPAATTPVDAVDELERAARQRIPEAHRVAGASHVVVSEGGEPLESLDEQTLVERDARGVLHAVYTNSRDQGREIFSAGDTVWVRPRYGKFHRRPPAEPDEAERVAGEIGSVFASHLELCARGLAVRDAGATTVVGRRARRLILGRGTPRSLPGETAPQRAWRDGASVDALEGEVLLDDATGAILLGRLAARVGFVRDGRRLEMTLSSTQEVQAVGAVTVMPPPDEHSSPTPGRSTEFEDRESLLSGLAAPARRSPAPAAKGSPP